MLNNTHTTIANKIVFSLECNFIIRLHNYYIYYTFTATEIKYSQSCTVNAGLGTKIDSASGTIAAGDTTATIAFSGLHQQQIQQFLHQ